MCSLVPEPPVCQYCRLPLALDEFGQCKECRAEPVQKKCACGDLTPNTSGVCNACAVKVGPTMVALNGAFRMLGESR